MGTVKDKYLADLNVRYPTRQFTEVVVDDFTDLDWYEGSHSIDAVSDNLGTARFVVTGGPTVEVGNEIRISGFTGSNLPYNGNHIVSAVVSEDIECEGVDFILTEASGSFDLLVDRLHKMLPDDAYKNLRESAVGFVEDDLIEDLHYVQTTDNTDTVAATITIADETTNLLNVDVIGIKSDGTDRATYKGIQSAYRTGAGNAALLSTASVIHSAESDASWSGVSFDVTGNDVEIIVKGKNSTTIDWYCAVDTVSFPG